MLLLSTLQALRPNDVPMAKQKFLQFQQELQQADPQGAQARMQQYAAVSAKIEAAIQQLPPEEQQPIYQYIDEVLIRPIIRGDHAGDVVQASQRFQHVLTQLMEYLKVPHPMHPPVPVQGAQASPGSPVSPPGGEAQIV